MVENDEIRYLERGVYRLLEELYNRNFFSISTDDITKTIYEYTNNMDQIDIKTSEYDEFKQKYFLLEQLILIFYYLFQRETKDLIIPVNDSATHALQEIKDDNTLEPLRDILNIDDYQNDLNRWEENTGNFLGKKIYKKTGLRDDIRKIEKVILSILNNTHKLIACILKNTTESFAKKDFRRLDLKPLNFVIKSEISDEGNPVLKVSFQNYLFSEKKIIILQESKKINDDGIQSSGFWFAVSFHFVMNRFVKDNLEINHFNFLKHMDRISIPKPLFSETHSFSRKIESIDNLLYLLKLISELIILVINLDQEGRNLNDTLDDKEKIEFYEKILRIDEKNVFCFMSLSDLMIERGQNDKSLLYVKKGLEFSVAQTNLFDILSPRLIQFCLRREDDISQKLMENFILHFEKVTLSSQEIIFDTLQELKSSSLDFMLLSKLHLLSPSDAVAILARFKGYNRLLNDTDNAKIARESMKQLCDQTREGKEWIPISELGKNLGSYDLKTVIPLAIVNFREGGLILLKGDKLSLTKTGKSQCDKPITLKMSI